MDTKLKIWYFCTHLSKKLCKMVMRKAKNCQNYRYSQNRHFEFFSFLGNSIYIVYLKNYYLTKFLYDNFKIFPITLINMVGNGLWTIGYKQKWNHQI